MDDISSFVPPENAGEKLVLQLYVTGMSQKSMEAIANVKHLCETYFPDNFQLEIIDLYKNPKLAAERQIVFSPSLIKLNPLPRKILVGNMADAEKVKFILGIPNNA